MPKIFRLPKHVFPLKKFLTPRVLGLTIFVILGVTALVQQILLKSTSPEVKVEEMSVNSGIITVGSTIIPTFTPIPASPTHLPLQSTPTTSSKSESVSQIIDLTNWKLTLPSGSPESPTEIRQPQLSTYQNDPFFVVSEGNNIRFRAPVSGVTTKGSKYPRSELREMSNGGGTNASWSTNSGIHTLFLDQAITAVPQTKKHVVAGQIHDADDDVIVIRLEDARLYVNVDGKNVYTLDSSYSLGKRFTIKFVVNNGQTKVYYNDEENPAYVLNKSYSGAYFKTGAYTQSNCSKESLSSCNGNNFGEVIVYRATVTH